MLTANMKFTFKNWEQHGGRNCAHIGGMGNVSSKGVLTAAGATVKIDKGNVAEDFWFDPELGMVAGNENDDFILKITTRWQTMSEEEHYKSHWTVAEAQ